MKNNLLLGCVFALTSALFYALQTAFIKHSMLDVALPVIIFVQSFVCFILITCFLAYKEGKHFRTQILSSQVKRKHVARAVFSLAISYFLFASIKHISYFDSMLLYNTAPLFVPFIGYFLLNNKINHSLWLFIITGFIGVLLTFHPDGNILSPAALLALMSGIAAACSLVMIRNIAQDDNSLKSLFFYFLYSTLISALISLPYWHTAYLSLYLSLILIGVLFFCVQFFLTLAAFYTTPQVVSSLYYSNILFSLFIACLLFNEKTSLLILVGSALIIFGGFGVIHRQRKTA